MFYNEMKTLEEKFEYVKNHCMYYTMNSWNGAKSIANNVKIYNLKLDGDKWLAFDRLVENEYYVVNQMIKDWEYQNPNYTVGFNGSSGGYLVLYNKNNYRNVLYDIYDQTYEEALENESKEDLEYKVESDYKIVKSFDILCDDIREYVNKLSIMTNEEYYGIDDESSFTVMNIEIEVVKEKGKRFVYLSTDGSSGYKKEFFSTEELGRIVKEYVENDYTYNIKEMIERSEEE